MIPAARARISGQHALAAVDAMLAAGWELADLPAGRQWVRVMVVERVAGLSGLLVMGLVMRAVSTQTNSW